MLRPGTKVSKLTKRVGQASPQGKIIAVKGDSYEVEWEDGHVSLISRIGVTPVKPKK